MMPKRPVVLALQTIILLQGVSVVLGNDLSLFASEIGSQFKDLYQPQQLLCSQNALYEFINECQLRGADSVSPKLRIQLAVKLSICEFKEANVEYPKSCQNVECDEDFEMCVQEFLESPQLWTTYSGHYRRLRSVCYEEAVPFIRHNILDLFFNVTKIYTDFQLSAMKTSSKAQDLQEQLLAKFQAIVDLMDESFTHQEEQKREEAKTFDDFHNSMLERSRYFEDAWDYMSLEISTNTNKIDQSLSETHQKLQLIFDFVDTQFARILTANENLAKIHVQASQSISDDLMMLYQNSKSGQLVLQDILEDNLHKGLQINYLLQDTHLQVENMFEDIEKETRAIVANVTRELKDEALSLFIVFQTTFESTFSQLMFLSQNIGHIIFSMDAASLNLNSSLVILHERVQDLKSINMSSILSSVMLSPKVVSCVLVAICMFQFMFRWEHGQGAFMSAIFFGAFTTYLARSVIFAMFT